MSRTNRRIMNSSSISEHVGIVRSHATQRKQAVSKAKAQRCLEHHQIPAQPSRSVSNFSALTLISGAPQLVGAGAEASLRILRLVHFF